MKVNTLTATERAFLKKLGTRIRRLRQGRDWTLEDTEEHGWSDWTHLQKIEGGKNITIVTVRKIARLFKIPVSELLADL